MRPIFILLSVMVATQSYALEAMSEQAMRTVGEPMAASTPSASMLDCQSSSQNVKQVCDVPTTLVATPSFSSTLQVDTSGASTIDVDATTATLSPSQVGTQIQTWVGAVQVQMNNLQMGSGMMGPRH